MGIRAYYVNGLSNESSDKSGKGDPVAPVAPADNVLMHAIYYSDLNATTGQWSTRKPIYIENLIDGNAVDPNLVQLQDGSWLLAISNPTSANAALHASQDALNFTAKGVTLATFSPVA